MPPTASSRNDDSDCRSISLGEMIARGRQEGSLDELPESLLPDSQRDRILLSLAQSCARVGYGATTIGDITGGAEVSRATFYKLFKDKDDCLRAAMEMALADGMATIVEVYSPDKTWSTMVCDATVAFLELLARRPAFARMALVEAPAAGPRSLELHASGKRVLQSLIERGRDDPVEEEAIPSSAARAALAAAETLVVGQILAGNTARLPQLAPDVVYILTVPYLGQEEALRQARLVEKEVSPEAAPEGG